MQIRCVPLLVVAFSFPLFAQSGIVGSSMSSNAAGVVKGTMHLSPPLFAGTPVTGAPYSAQRVSEHVQTASDGTRFTTTIQQETLYRDSQGRTRTERPLAVGSNAPDSPLLVEISDPVANVGYTLDTQNKIAQRFTYSALPVRQTGVGGVGAAGGGVGVRAGILGGSVAPPPPGSGAPPAPIASPASPVAAQSTSTAAAGAVLGARPHPEVTHEDLGAQVIEGVMAKGQRSIQTWPAGSQGNDRPFQSISEIWMSPDLNIVVLSKNADPRMGEGSIKLVNINRAEPPSTLFAPPPDFTLVDETGPFEIQWTGTRPR
jgi:hypothetical protein